MEFLINKLSTTLLGFHFSHTLNVKVKVKKSNLSCAQLIKHYATKEYGAVDV
jgi:hypothetical protein